MSVEEAIEILKEIIELHEDNCYLSTEDDFKAIKTLIVAYKKQSKERQADKEKIKELEEEINSKKDVIEYFENLAKESGEIDEGR